jgi:hypothetical protein
MPLWTFTVTHQDQSVTTGMKDIIPQAPGFVVVIPDLLCRCGHSHTLRGMQTLGHKAGGKGPESVHPQNDPGRPKHHPEIDEVPSWDGSPSGP